MPQNDKDLLGHTVRDKVSGLQGVCTGVVRYLSGCVQGLVTPKVPDSEPHKGVDSYWFDVQRLEVVDFTSRMILDNTATPGHDTPAPKR